MKKNLSFDSAVYHLDTVKSACYRLSDRFSVMIEMQGQEIVCHLEFPSSRDDKTISADISELKKEVLDQDLRLRIKAETEPTRVLILAHAFSKTGLIADEQVPADPVLRQ